MGGPRKTPNRMLEHHSDPEGLSRRIHRHPRNSGQKCVVDSLDLRLFGAGARFGDPRGGDPKLARCFGEGQADLCHKLDGQGAPDRTDPAPATPLVEFRKTDSGLSAPPANGFPGHPQPHESFPESHLQRK